MICGRYPALRNTSAPVPTPISAGWYSLMKGLSDLRSSSALGSSATITTCLRRRSTSMSGMPMPSISSGLSLLMNSMVLPANASRWAASPLLASRIRSAMSCSVRSVPRTSRRSPAYTPPSYRRILAPSLTFLKMSGPASSISVTPLLTSTSGPRLG